MEDCIFCKIANGNIPVKKVYEDDKVLAFLDNNPIEKGHTLVIPKEHYKDIFETPDELVKYMYSKVKIITEAISKSLDIKEFNILQNNGSKAGQSVFHYHIHIIPRIEKFRLCFGSGEVKLDDKIRDEDLCSEEIAKLIRKEF
jgi:histidine triad (HIT) family protein